MSDTINYLSLFKMPTQMKITGRSSSITNAFVNSIIPIVAPTNYQIKKALKILGMSYTNFECSYCGSAASEWDHLRPLVVNKRPTGYISEIYNLVPACGKCNQSKGNKPWADWIVSDAKLSLNLEK
jgi:5-methylcytosine-specific restriction endonuclease McrA